MGWHPDNDVALKFGNQQFNDTDFLATPARVGVVVTVINGLFDSPPQRQTNRNRPGKRGARAGPQLDGPRPFTIEGIAWSTGDPDLIDLETRIIALSDILKPGEIELFEFTHQTLGDLQMDARLENTGLVWGDPFEFGVFVGRSFIGAFVAHDPNLYSDELFTFQTSDIATSGGRVYPRTYPLTYGEATIGGTVIIPAGGNTERPAILRLFGPATNPIVEVVGSETEKNITFESLAIGNGDVVTVDLDEETATLVAADSGVYSSVIRSLNPAAYWRFGETSGTTAFDDGGLQDATYNAGFTLGATGALLLDSDFAVNLNGSTGFIDATFAATLNPPTFTIEGWIFRTTSGVLHFLWDSTNAGLTKGFALQVTASNVLKGEIYDGAAATAVTGSIAIAASTYTHFAMTYDGTVAELFVDGVSDGVSAAVTLVPNITDDTTLGATTAGASHFPGRLDEFAIYPTVLSDTEILRHAQLAGQSAAAPLDVYGDLNFELTRFFLLPAEAHTLRYRALAIDDPAFMEVEFRDARK